MIKRGISGIVLCFFCCVNCFPVYVFAELWEDQQNTEVNEVSNSWDESDEEMGNQTEIDEMNLEVQSESTDSGMQEDENTIEVMSEDEFQDFWNSENQDTPVSTSQWENSEVESWWEDQSASWSENTWSWEVQENNIIIPGIFIDFQNPSYLLEKDIQKDNYSCDPDKPECKINLKILDESQQDYSSDFRCEIKFSTGEFFDNCNPTSVIMTQVENNFLIKVFEIDNPDNFIEKNIIIFNNSNEIVEEDEIQEDSEETVSQSDWENSEIESWWDDQTWSWTENTWSWEVQENKVIIPGIFIDFQNPSYILEKDIQKEDYLCDPDKTECKINLKILDENQQDFSSDFWCEINYGTWEILEICNPTTIVLIEWESNVWVKVFEINNPENFSEKSINISNTSNETVDISEQEETDNQEDSGEIIPQEETVEEENSEAELGWENHTGSWNENTWSWEIQEDNIIIPGIFIDFQNPSYILEKDIQKDNYLCDSDKQECKINLKILDENQQDFSSDFWCEINYGTWKILETCNPTTIVLIESENNIWVKIFEINNPDNFNEKNIIIFNNLEENKEIQEDSSEIIPQEESIEKQTPESETGSWESTDAQFDENNVWENFTFPEIDLEIQSGWNLSWNSIYCDKNDCSLNLNLEDNFSEHFSQWDYLCEWDFVNWIFSTQNTHKKCNPGYVKYSIWMDQISVKLIQKDNVDNYITEYYIVENPEVIRAKSSWSNSNSQNNSSSENTQVDITVDKDIIVQSWAENFICEESLCSINLKYANASYESCVWDFLWYQEDEKYTHSCNPRNIYLPAGIHKITLNVFNKKTDKYHDKFISIYNKFEEENIELENEIFELILQWKETEYRKYIGNKIICLWVEKCNINLATKGSSKYTYAWDFWNTMTSDKMNPTWIWFDIWKFCHSQTENKCELQGYVSYWKTPNPS